MAFPHDGKKMKKGETLNPNGRPRKLPELDKLLADVLGEEKDGISAAELILKALRLKAAKGDVRAIEVMLDRAYGKAPQTINHEGLPTTVTFNFTDMSGDNSEENELL
jgi:hypothetical protein